MIASPEFSPAIATDASVRITSLVVDYGKTRAIDELDLAIPRGEILGLLGPNGAGKSTLFQVLSTLLSPTSGQVELAGLPIAERVEDVRARLSFMPDLAPLPSDLRVVEYLRAFAECYGIRGKERDRRVEIALDEAQLGDRAKALCKKLSLGMRQRLAFAKALLHHPEVILLDEPASGLDAVSRKRLRQALERQAARGTTIILSSHVLGDIEDLCTSIAFIQAGKILEVGRTKEVLTRQNRTKNRVRIQAPGRLPELRSWVSEHGGLVIIDSLSTEDSLVIEHDDSTVSATHLFREISAVDLGVTSYQPVEVSLEDVILGLSQPPTPS